MVHLPSCQLHISVNRTAQIYLELHFCVELHTKKALYCGIVVIKSAVCFFCRPGTLYLGVGATSPREILHDGTAMFRTGLLPFWWHVSLNAGSRKGLGWTIFGLSDTDYCHLTANISKTVSRKALHIKWGITPARLELSKNVGYAAGR